MFQRPSIGWGLCDSFLDKENSLLCPVDGKNQITAGKGADRMLRSQPVYQVIEKSDSRK